MQNEMETFQKKSCKVPKNFWAIDEIETNQVRRLFVEKFEYSFFSHFIQKKNQIWSPISSRDSDIALKFRVWTVESGVLLQVAILKEKIPCSKVHWRVSSGYPQGSNIVMNSWTLRVDFHVAPPYQAAINSRNFDLWHELNLKIFDSIKVFLIGLSSSFDSSPKKFHRLKWKF